MPTSVALDGPNRAFVRLLPAQNMPEINAEFVCLALIEAAIEVLARLVMATMLALIEGGSSSRAPLPLAPPSLPARSTMAFAKVFEEQAAPCPRVNASRASLAHLDMPVLLTGAADIGEWRIADVLDGNFSIPVEVSPVRNMPLKLWNDTCVRPAERLMRLQPLLRLLRKPRRRFAAYVRSLPLWAVPELAERLPLARALALAGPRLQERRLWLGDGSMRSGVHHDAMDNLIVQLSGSKRVLLLSPRARPAVRYRAYTEHRFVFDDASGEFRGHAPTGEARVENHASIDVFGDAADPEACTADGDVAEAARFGTICEVGPGDALFVPALWPHAVISAPARAADAQPGHDSDASELNMMINLWFVHEVRAHAHALQLQPQWALGYSAMGDALTIAARHAEARAAYKTASALNPSPLPPGGHVRVPHG